MMSNVEVRRHGILPPELADLLRKCGEQIEKGEINCTDLDSLLSLMSELPIESFDRLRQQIAQEARLWRNADAAWGMVKFFRKRDSFRLLLDEPELAWLFLFHFDGRLREAALLAIRSPREGAFFFAAIAYRLNDWVAPVRAAANNCAKRVLKDFRTQDVAEAGLCIFGSIPLWQRTRDFDALREVFMRPDVTTVIVERIKTLTTGKVAQLLGAVIYNDNIRPHLCSFVTEAIRPSVRAAALKWVTSGVIKWPDYTQPSQKRWVDKSMGRFRMEPHMNHITVEHDEPLVGLIAVGLHDSSAMVRKVAMWKFLEYKALWKSNPLLVERMRRDKNSAIREGANYIIGQLSKQND